MAFGFNSGRATIPNNRIIAQTSADFTYSLAYLETNLAFGSNFDVQVDFSMGSDWSSPPAQNPGSHLDGAVFGVAFDASLQDWIHFTRLSDPDSDNLGVFSSINGFLYDQQLTSINDLTSGQFRIVRTGSIFDFYLNTGTGWQQLCSVTHPAGPVILYMGNASIECNKSFTTYFDNFIVNSAAFDIGGSISGQVDDSNGHPVPDASVR